MLRFRLYAFGLVLSTTLSARAQAPEHAEFCSVFDRLTSWDDRMVEINGFVEARRASEGGLWFTGFCKGTIEARGFSFPKEFVLMSPANKPLVLHPVSFDWNIANYNEYLSFVSRMNPDTEIIRLTVVGLLETRVPLESLVVFNVAHPDGVTVGFGHLGGFPAQIVVKEVSGLRVEKKPPQ